MGLGHARARTAWTGGLNSMATAPPVIAVATSMPLPAPPWSRRCASWQMAISACRGSAGPPAKRSSAPVSATTIAALEPRPSFTRCPSGAGLVEGRRRQLDLAGRQFRRAGQQPARGQDLRAGLQRQAEGAG